MSEQQIEQEIQAKGLTAPRVIPAQIDAAIAGEAYHVFEGSCLTLCCLTLQNGFTVTGESACASPENFNAELGRKIARDKARDKIWTLEGYLLRQRLHEERDPNSELNRLRALSLSLATGTNEIVDFALNRSRSCATNGEQAGSIFETAAAARAAGPEEKY
jgi:hypothetical protein